MSSQNQTPAVPLEQAGGNIASPLLPMGRGAAALGSPDLRDSLWREHPTEHHGLDGRRPALLSPADLSQRIQYKDIKIMCVSTGVAET